MDDATTLAAWHQIENEQQRREQMDVSGFLTSNGALLKKEDIGKHRPIVTIESVDITEFDGDKKLVLRFHGKDKGMALNKTNTLIIAEAFGHESDHWIGQQVELWVDPYVTFAGKVVGGLKITPVPVKPPPPPPTDFQDDSEIPF